MVPPPPKEFLYPYTIWGQARHFPWKWMWKNGKFHRFMVYGWVVAFPAIWAIDNAVHSPGNVEEWKKRRAARDHTFFDAPHE